MLILSRHLKSCLFGKFRKPSECVVPPHIDLLTLLTHETDLFYAVHSEELVVVFYKVIDLPSSAYFTQAMSVYILHIFYIYHCLCYQLTPRSIRISVDYWSELLRVR